MLLLFLWYEMTVGEVYESVPLKSHPELLVNLHDTISSNATFWYKTDKAHLTRISEKDFNFIIKDVKGHNFWPVK
jgi:hypothetical protein